MLFLLIKILLSLHFSVLAAAAAQQKEKRLCTTTLQLDMLKNNLESRDQLTMRAYVLAVAQLLVI